MTMRSSRRPRCRRAQAASRLPDWTSRVDAVTDAVGEVFAQYPVPDTGDLRRDLEAYLTKVSDVMSSARGRQVIGALVTEAATNEELMLAFRDRVVAPRRAELVARIEQEPERLAGQAAAAVDQLIGPVYYRSVIAGLPLDPISRLERPQSLADMAYRAVRERIATGVLAPGQRLSDRRLAMSLGVSPTPVREALRCLEQEGLVERSTPRSLAVAEHPDEALRELLYGEAVLRTALARFATAKMADEAIDELSSVVDELGALADTAAAAEVLAVAARFDAILTEAAASPPLLSLVAGASVVGHARRLQAVAAMRGSSRQVGLRHLQAHRDIVAALRQRDPGRVERLVRDHLLSSAELLLSDLGGQS